MGNSESLFISVGGRLNVSVGMFLHMCCVWVQGYINTKTNIGA